MKYRNTSSGNSHIALSTPLVLVAAVAAAPLYAQSGSDAPVASSGPKLEEVLVTANRRSESLFDIPISMSSISESEILNQGITNMESFYRKVPSLNILDNGASRKNIIIRGLQTSESFENSLTSVYINDLLVTADRFTINPRTFDLARIEVLRGPQGTLYGGGSMSGTVRYITNRPDPGDFHANFAATLSNTEKGSDNYSFDAMANIPIIEDVLAARIVGYTGDQSGFYKNEFLGKDNQGQVDEEGARLSILWNASDKATLLASVNYARLDQDGWFQAQGDFKELNQDKTIQEGMGEKSVLYDLTFEYDFGWGYLTSVTGFLEFDSYLTEDRTFLGISEVDPMLRQAVLDDVNHERFSQEIRLVSAPESFGKLDWVAGYYYSDDENNQYVGDFLGLGNDYVRPGAGEFLGAIPGQDFALPNPDGSYNDSLFEERGIKEEEQHALFGELTWNWTDALSTTIGARTVKVTSSRGADALISESFSGADFAFSESFSQPEFDEEDTVYKFNVSYDVNQDFMLYAQRSEGFRPGGGEEAPFIPPQCTDLATDVLGGPPQAVESDSMETYELGTKLSLGNGSVQINAAAFHSDWKDIQVELFLGGTSTCGIFFVQNAASATSEGIELEVTAQPLDSLLLSLSGSYVDATLDEDEPDLNASGGDRLPGAPDYQFTASGEYTMPINDQWTASGYLGVQYVGEILGKFSSDPEAPRTESGDFYTTNVNLRLESERWSLVLFADNVFDERAATFGFRNEQANFVETSVLRPRTVGLTVRTWF